MAYQRYPLITEKNLVLYHDAFAQTGEESAQTQSAVLLCVGVLLRKEPEAPEAGAEERPLGELFPEDDWAALAIPKSLLDLRKHRGARYRTGLLRDELGATAAERLKGARDFQDPEAETTFKDVQVSLSEQLTRDPDPDIAARLVENSLNHPQPLARVAAASSGFDLFPEDEDRAELLALLVEGLDSEDELVRELAATVLARVEPSHPRLGPLTPPGKEEEQGDPQHTSLLIHGTWARDNSWWQPSGDFHTYILNDVRPDLYSQPDRFDWSGGYSDAARSIAAGRLEIWITERQLNGLDLFCHSHGGSVAMEANHASLQINQLVLLSCPVHPDKYAPNFDQVNDVVSIRVKFDLVILADGGGQRFRDDRIRENRLPIWFNHSASHDPEVWQNHDVPALL
ncbi:MAG: hypothetical protein OEU36_24580 [Gammaproteobacteria bacterium]|nr:hypothetical protein [Gammaproteobacteria bacterium]